MRNTSFIKVTILLAVLFAFVSYKSLLSDSNVSLDKINYGLSVYKKANCMGCHSWHGKGGGGYGAGVSLRTSVLSPDELYNVIKCGRPGTGMPYFYKNSYIKESCYDSLLSDYDENYRPITSRRFLNNNQIKGLVFFIQNQLQGKLVSKEYCYNFFRKKTKVCSNLP